MTGRAIIVGAGIGGLAVGRALLDTRWRVEILERADGLPEAGTALGMWPEAIAALDRLGVGDRVREAGVAQHGATFRRPEGTTFARITSREPAYLISRPALHRIVYEGALEDAVRWATPVEDAANLPEADLVIGADGINSRLRTVVAGRTVDPRPLGAVAFRGVVPGRVEAACETWGDGRVFGVTPQEAGMTNWFASVREDVLAERPSYRNVAELLTALFGDWHPIVREVVTRLDPADIDQRVLYEMPPVGSLSRDHRVILGDAAHAMAPNAGRGACEAIVDAVTLAESLSTAGSSTEGLQEFDRRRRRTGQRMVRASRVLSRISLARRLPAVRYRAMNVLSRFASTRQEADDDGNDEGRHGHS